MGYQKSVQLAELSLQDPAHHHAYAAYDSGVGRSDSLAAGAERFGDSDVPER